MGAFGMRFNRLGASVSAGRVSIWLFSRIASSRACRCRHMQPCGSDSRGWRGLVQAVLPDLAWQQSGKQANHAVLWARWKCRGGRGASPGTGKKGGVAQGKDEGRRVTMVFRAARCDASRAWQTGKGRAESFSKADDGNPGTRERQGQQGQQGQGSRRLSAASCCDPGGRLGRSSTGQVGVGVCRREVREAGDGTCATRTRRARMPPFCPCLFWRLFWRLSSGLSRSPAAAGDGVGGPGCRQIGWMAGHDTRTGQRTAGESHG